MDREQALKVLVRTATVMAQNLAGQFNELQAAILVVNEPDPASNGHGEMTETEPVHAEQSESG